MEIIKKSIGGFFELESPPKKSYPYPGTVFFQSARACFRVLLESKMPSAVWMPKYICDAFIKPVLDLGINIHFYDIGLDLLPTKYPKLKSEDVFVYVNYFGLCDVQVSIVLSKFNADQVILDHSQAFFTSPNICLGTIYSPRKFFGVSDGGGVITKVDIITINEYDLDSTEHAIHLFKRTNLGPEQAYADFLKSEARLNDTTPKKMSISTNRLLQSINFDAAKKIRSSNFNYLHSKLASGNEFNINPGYASPLCYPFHCADAKKIKDKLIRNSIYIPTYWTDVLKRVEVHSSEYKLTNDVVYLPCDHRYDVSDMDRVLEIIN